MKTCAKCGQELPTQFEVKAKLAVKLANSVVPEGTDDEISRLAEAYMDLSDDEINAQLKVAKLAGKE